MTDYRFFGVRVEKVDALGFPHRQPVGQYVPIQVSKSEYAGRAMKTAGKALRDRWGRQPFHVFRVQSFTTPVVYETTAVRQGTATYIEDTWHPKSASSPGDGDGFARDMRYLVGCEAHATYIMVGSLQGAKVCARYPHNFCEECQAALDHNHKGGQHGQSV